MGTHDTPAIRESAYGPAAERYSRERELGRLVSEMLREPAMMDDCGEYVRRIEVFAARAVAAARRLGLLPASREEAPRG